MSDELDIAFDKTSCVTGSTDVTIRVDPAARMRSRPTGPIRRVAAEARRVLLEMACDGYPGDLHSRSI